MFIVKNAAPHIKTPKDEKTRDSPIIIIMTPESIGLRTREYGPVATSFCVGAQGAKVPFPMVAKSLIVQTAKNRPVENINNPNNMEYMLSGTDRAPVKYIITNGIVTTALKGNAKTAFIQERLMFENYLGRLQNSSI